MVKSGQHIKRQFSTHDSSQLANPDSTPVGRLVVNGVDTAEAVTVVTTGSTGQWTAEFTIPALADRALVQLRIAAEFGALPTETTEWEDFVQNVTAASSVALNVTSSINLARFRKEVGLTDPGAAEDLLREVISLWEEQTGRLWVSREDYEVIVEPGRDGIIFLPLYPVTDITVEESDINADDEYEEVESEDHFFDSKLGTLRRTDGEDWSGFVRLTITGGYTEMPAAVVRAIITQAKYMAVRDTREAVAVTQMTTAYKGSSTLREGDFHPAFERAVRYYRRVTVC